MKLFYYKIKGRRQHSQYHSDWDFPPVATNIIEAENKKQAVTLIEEEYGRKFPQRILREDLGNEPFLLSIKELHPDSFEYVELLTEHTCKNCGIKHRRIDKYAEKTQYYGSDYCSWGCYNYDSIRIKEEIQRNLLGEGIRPDFGGIHSPMIYKITNKITNQSYIGKTTQAFTFRWYQHVFQNQGSTKFHKALNTSNVTDWIFEIIEVLPKEAGEKEISEREQYYITKFDTINNGYNSISSTSN